MIASSWIDLAKTGWGEVTPSSIVFSKFSEGSGLKKLSLCRGENKEVRCWQNIF